MFLLGSIVFGLLTLELFAGGPLLAWDTSLAKALPAIVSSSPAYVLTIMNIGFYLGEYVLVGLLALLVVYFIAKRSWTELAMTVLGPVGSTALFLWLSNLIGRSRPPTQIGISTTIPGFPSGHSIAVVVVYGLTAYLLVPAMRTKWGKALVIAGAVLLMLFVGATRVFTAGHYLTDVVAGYAVGIAWSGVIYTAIELLSGKWRRTHGTG